MILVLTSHKRKPHRGFTLTELAIVLAIIGIIIGGIWEAASNVKKNAEANQAAQDIMTIASNIRSSFTAANAFGGSAAATAALIAAGDIPVDLLVSGSTTTLANIWGGAVTITEDPTLCPLAGVNYVRVFRITYTNVPYDACIRIANQLTSLGTNDAPFQLITNSCANPTPISTPTHPVGGVPVAPLPAATIATACGANPPGGGSLEFDFTIH